ncbi:hypothetical protein ACOSQ3_010797 [Xanthoceras sorbifolium]
MLSSALKFQNVFDRLMEKDGCYGLYFFENENGKRRVGPPKENDWSKTKVFFNSSLSVTSNLFFHELCSIETELTSLAKNDDNVLSEMTSSMKSKFDKYWGKIEDVNC